MTLEEFVRRYGDEVKHPERFREDLLSVFTFVAGQTLREVGRVVKKTSESRLTLVQ